MRIILILCFLCLQVNAQSPKNVSSINEAMLQSTIANQKAFKEIYRPEKTENLQKLSRVKHAAIKKDAIKEDGFGEDIDGKYYVPNRKTHQEAIQHYREIIKKQQEQENHDFLNMPPIIDFHTFAKGQVGLIGDSLLSPIRVKVLQVLGPSSFLGTAGSCTFLIRDVSTQTMADGSLVKLTYPVEVMGTEQYTTVLGATNTIFSLRMLTREEFLKAIAFVNQHKLKIEPQLRRWRGHNGEAIIDAEYISQDKMNIIVRDEEGVEQEISISKLCKEDRDWIKHR
jgi:hypothetical protein